MPIKHTVWVIFWRYFAWAHCDRFSWEQQFPENSQWLRHDFSLHPWQLFYLLARLLTALSVRFSSKQSDPGSDRSSIRGSDVQPPPTPLPPTSWQTTAKAANWSGGCRTTSPSCAAQAETFPVENPASIFTIAVRHIRCPEQRYPLPRLSGHIKSPDRQKRGAAWLGTKPNP